MNNAFFRYVLSVPEVNFLPVSAEQNNVPCNAAARQHFLLALFPVRRSAFPFSVFFAEKKEILLDFLRKDC